MKKNNLCSCGHNETIHGIVGCMYFNKNDKRLTNGYCLCRIKGNYGKREE